MINLVYAVIAPIVSFVLAGCFAILGAMFRHHFVYIYPQHPDSGGQIWIGFILISKYFHDVRSLFLYSLAHPLLKYPIFSMQSRNAFWLPKLQVSD